MTSNSQDPNITERLDAIEDRLKRIEQEVLRRKEVVVIDETKLQSIREAVKMFLAQSSNLEGKWKGESSSVEEVKKMRKHGRGY